MNTNISSDDTRPLLPSQEVHKILEEVERHIYQGLIVIDAQKRPLHVYDTASIDAGAIKGNPCFVTSPASWLAYRLVNEAMATDTDYGNAMSPLTIAYTDVPKACNPIAATTRRLLLQRFAGTDTELQNRMSTIFSKLPEIEPASFRQWIPYDSNREPKFPDSSQNDRARNSLQQRLGYALDELTRAIPSLSREQEDINAAQKLVDLFLSCGFRTSRETVEQFFNGAWNASEPKREREILLAFDNMLEIVQSPYEESMRAPENAHRKPVKFDDLRYEIVLRVIELDKQLAAKSTKRSLS